MLRPVPLALLTLCCLLPLAVAYGNGDSPTTNTVPQQEAGKGGKAAADEAEQRALDLEQLVERLKQTEAIGFLTKLAIRADVLDFRDLVEKQRKQHRLQANMGELRSRFDGLLLKILVLLEDDPQLSKDVYLARENIWKSLVEVKDEKVVNRNGRSSSAAPGPGAGRYKG